MLSMMVIMIHEFSVEKSLELLRASLNFELLKFVSLRKISFQISLISFLKLPLDDVRPILRHFNTFCCFSISFYVVLFSSFDIQQHFRRKCPDGIESQTMKDERRETTEM